MLVRRLVVAFAVLLTGPAVWAASAEPAHAGGPTSVLLSNPERARVHSLYTTSSAYNRLHAAVGEPAGGDPTEPPYAHGHITDAVTLTWLVHDVSVWRIDSVVVTRDDGIWVGTVVDVTGEGNLRAQSSRWHRAKDDKALTSVLSAAGLIGEQAKPPAADSPTPAPEVAADPTSEVATGAATTPGGPSAGAVAAGAGLAGLVIGAAGTLLLRRARSTIRPPRSVLTG